MTTGRINQVAIMSLPVIQPLPRTAKADNQQGIGPWCEHRKLSPVCEHICNERCLTLANTHCGCRMQIACSTHDDRDACQHNVCDIMEPYEHTQVATIRTPMLCCSRLRIAAFPIVKHQHTDLSLLFSQVVDHRVANIPRLVIGVRDERRPITSQGEIANQHPCRAQTAKVTVAL
jgi:hypothetical protein